MRGKNALQNWGHFQMNWTFVKPTTQIKSGAKFCVCVKEFLPWLMMPLQVVYVNENKSAGPNGSSYKKKNYYSPIVFFRLLLTIIMESFWMRPAPRNLMGWRLPIYKQLMSILKSVKRQAKHLTWYLLSQAMVDVKLERKKDVSGEDIQFLFNFPLCN